MIQDKLTTLVDNLPATSSGVLGDVIDIKKSGIDIGTGYPLYMVVTSSSAVAGGPATLSLLTSDSADLSSPTTVASLSITAAGAGETLAAVALPTANYKRYIGVSMGGTTLSSGDLTVALTMDVPNLKTYSRA